LTKLCPSCGRLLDDHARFCDRCRLVQPSQPPPQIEHRYSQLPEPQVSLHPPQPQPTPVSLSRPQRAGILGRIRRHRKPLQPTAMPVTEATPRQPPEPGVAAVAAPSPPAVRVSKRRLRSFGRKLNHAGILGGIVAFASLVMPWWTATASVPVVGLGNSTAIDFPLYLYEASASVLASPPSQVVTLDLWFCLPTLALLALAGILAIVGSVMIGKGRWMLLIGGVLALVSTVLFAVGLWTELSRVGSGLDLFKIATENWGTISARLSFGFWGGLIAGVVMLLAAVRSRAIATAPPVT